MPISLTFFFIYFFYKNLHNKSNILVFSTFARLEWFWTLVPVLMLCFLAFPTFLFLFDVSFLVVKRIAGFFLSVQVLGNQWFWSGFYIFFEFFNKVKNITNTNASVSSFFNFSENSPQNFVFENSSLFPELFMEEEYVENLFKQEFLDANAIFRFKQFNFFVDFLNLNSFSTLNSYVYLRFFYAHLVYFYGVSLNIGENLYLRTGLVSDSYLYVNFFNPVKNSPLLFDTDSLSNDLVVLEEIYFLLLFRGTNLDYFDFFTVCNFFTLYDKNKILEKENVFFFEIFKEFFF